MMFMDFATGLHRGQVSSALALFLALPLSFPSIP
jgi:hypothetical protein